MHQSKSIKTVTSNEQMTMGLHALHGVLRAGRSDAVGRRQIPQPCMLAGDNMAAALHVWNTPSCVHCSAMRQYKDVLIADEQFASTTTPLFPGEDQCGDDKFPEQTHVPASVCDCSSAPFRRRSTHSISTNSSTAASPSAMRPCSRRTRHESETPCCLHQAAPTTT